MWATPTKWYTIPFGLGALVLLFVQYRKARPEPFVQSASEEGAVVKANRRVDGPWQVRVLGALPLRSLSQLWGYLNGLVLPVWFRPYGFRLYSYIFGCNLKEAQVQDLKQFDSLGEFFYRELKEGLRPIEQAPMVGRPQSSCLAASVSLHLVPSLADSLYRFHPPMVEFCITAR